MAGKPGVLLLNLGTPKSPEPQDVGIYLKEFLMDPYVIDIPFLARWFLVNVLIVPKRKHASSLLYKKIWTDRGSPLLFYTEDLLRKVRPKTPHLAVEMCMRYGEPSIEKGLAALRNQGVSSLTVLPLYPQYSLAASESSKDRVHKVLKKTGWSVPVEFVPPFFENEKFLDAFVTRIQEKQKVKKYDKVLFSFHGLPERQVKRAASHATCVCDEKCCLILEERNKDCYRAQSYATARLLAQRLGLNESDYTVAFQSRLGRTPWIKPYSDHFYETYPKQGIKRLLVVSPSFVADCLETVEEISIRGREQFLENGGEELDLVPSLNAEESWVDAVADLISRAG